MRRVGVGAVNTAKKTPLEEELTKKVDKLKKENIQLKAENKELTAKVKKFEAKAVENKE